MPVNNPSKNIKVKQAHTFFVKDSQAPAYAEVYNKIDSEKNKPSSFMLTYDKKAIETVSKNYHIKLVVKLNTKIPLDLKNPNSYMSTNFDGIKLSIHALLPDLTVASKQFLTYLHDSDTKTNRYLVDISIDPKTTEAILDACADLDARPDGTIDFKMFNMNLLIGLIYKHDVESPVSTDTKPLKKEKDMFNMLGRDIKLVLLGNKSALDIEDAAFPTRPVSETESRLYRAYRDKLDHHLTVKGNASVAIDLLRKNITGVFFIDEGDMSSTPVDLNSQNMLTLCPSRVFESEGMSRYNSPVDVKQDTKDVLALCAVFGTNIAPYLDDKLNKLSLVFHTRPSRAYSAEETIKHVLPLSVYTVVLDYKYSALELIFDANLLANRDYIVSYEILVDGATIYSSPSNAKPLIIEQLDQTAPVNGYGLSMVPYMHYRKINTLSAAQYTSARRGILSAYGIVCATNAYPVLHISLQRYHSYGEQMLPPYSPMLQYNFGMPAMPPMPDFKQPENKPSEAIPSSKKSTTVTYDPADIKDKNEAAFYRELAGLFMRYGKELKLVPRSNDKANVSNLRY